MGRTFVETIMGAVVLAVAGIFLFFALSQSDLGVVKGYDLTANFASVGGLTNGSDVRINGIKVGTVLDQAIQPESFEARVRFSIRPDIHLPDDTVASVDSEGLLGSKFLKLEPGRSQTMIAAGGAVAKTLNSQSLEDKVGRIIFLATDSGKPDEKKQ
jgi:phospholipid/cholesterol/gamma-HCH transport system substrate-binding protein